MGLQQSAIRAATWTAVQNWGNQAFGLLVFAALVRLLDPESFGLVAYATAFIGLIQVLVRGGTGMAVVQRETIEPEHLDAAFWYSMAVALVLATSLSASAESVAAALGEAGLAAILPALSLLLVVEAFSGTQRAILRRGLRFRELAVRVLIANSLGGAAGVVAAISGLGIWSLVIQQLLGSALTAALVWAQSDWRPRLRFSMRHIRELFAFGGPATVTAIMWAITGRTDRLLIGRIMGSAPLGIYAVGSRGVRIIMQMVGNTITAVGLPVFSRMQLEPERMKQAYLKALRFSCLGLFPAYCGLAALSPSLVPILFGPGWEETVPIMQVLSLFGLSQAVQGFAAPIMNAMGKPKWVAAIAAANAVLTVGAIWLAVPYGLTAVAFAIALRGYVMIPVMLGGIHLLVGLRMSDLVRSFGASLTASIAIGLLAYGADRELQTWMDLALPRLVGIAFVCGVVYILLIRTMFRELYEEAWVVFGQAMPARLRKRV